MTSQAVGWKQRWYEVIFEADTRAGKAFDVLLLIAIFLSVLAIVLESVESIHDRFGALFEFAEWSFTILFTLEYAARIACAPRRRRYVRSFYGVIDLVSILPTYFMVLFPGAQTVAVLRALRLLRVFRVLKLAHMLSEATVLRQAFWASRSKIAVFLAFVAILVVLLGSLMHIIEGPDAGFTSIPQSMYWAVVTMTTVGYGDIAPQSAAGKAIAALVMVIGYSMIIIPIGIVSAELQHAGAKPVTTQVCGHCMKEGHDPDAVFCKYCGERL